MALIYVVQEFIGSTRVAADGKSLGSLRRGIYFFALIDPGEHHFCAIAHIGLSNYVSLHQLNAEAGETHYFLVHVTGAVAYDDFALTQLDLGEGKYLIAKAKFSASLAK